MAVSLFEYEIENKRMVKNYRTMIIYSWLATKTCDELFELSDTDAAHLYILSAWAASLSLLTNKARSIESSEYLELQGHRIYCLCLYLPDPVASIYISKSTETQVWLRVHV